MRNKGEPGRIVLGRRSFALFVFLFAVLLPAFTAIRAAAPRPVASPPRGQQAPSADVTRTGSAVFLIDYIKADKAEDFEAVMARVKEALEKSPVAERRRQAAGWKIFKTRDGAGEGQILYISVIDPVVPGADYSVPKILSEVFPTEVRALYDRYVAAFARGRLRLGATPLATMGQ